MKYGIFIHPFVEDPSKDDPTYGRVREGGPIEASQEGDNLEAFINNRKIIDDLGKDYRMMWNSDLWHAASRIRNSHPLDNFDFMITNIPRNPYARGLQLWNYGLSLGCFRDMKKNKPDMTIIAYTGAPKETRNWCRENGVYVIPRGRFGLDIELDDMKKIIQ